MGRVILGLLKGGVVGAALGALAFKLGVAGGLAAVVLYALVGGAAGLLCGRPPWRQDTFWTSALKGLFGLAVGGGLYFLARKLLGGAHASFTAALGAPDRPLVEVPLLLGPAIGAIWGIFVEVDDSAGPENRAGNKPGAAKTATAKTAEKP
jgi:hypothetical protein